MTSSTEIHVQEVLNNLRDRVENLDDSLTAVIAQHTAAQAQSSSLQQAQVEHDQNHVNHEELERIAHEHKQQQEEQTSSKQDHETIPQEPSSLAASVQESVIQLDPNNSSTLATVPITASSAPAVPVAKPVAGSEEWHKMRRDNHKEVERRRRETINAGINDLAACIPNPDKNKGQILRQAVKYIQTIQEQHQKLAGDHEALGALQFEREKAMIERNVAQNQLQALVTEHDQLKRTYEALRQEFEELSENKKRQRSE